MMNFEFAIPVARDDLLNKTGVSHYVVDEVLSPREIAGSLHDIRMAFRSKGCQCIFDNFDAFFSIICLQKDLDSETKEDAWTYIVKIGISLSSHLVQVLEDDLDPTTKRDSMNLVKMTSYLLCQYMEMFESNETMPSTGQVITKGKGRSKKKTSSLTLDWPRERESGMKTLLNLVQLHIHRFWDPPIVEEDFVSLVTNCCYKLLENPEINHIVNKDTRDAICHIISIMVKRHNHGLGASLKIIQLLQHFEHLVSPLAYVVHVCVNEYGHRSIVSELMREIGRMDGVDLSRDTSGTRAYSAFLVEMTEKTAVALLPNISLVMSHLDGESYTMRNGVLGAMGEILIRVLSKDDLDDKMKTTRDQFLDELEGHIHDVHAFVRSKVLQIWLRIVNEKCLPLPHQENLLSLVIGRLQDKSSQVRRYAIQLITTLLKNNPFASKLSCEELEESYGSEKQKLQDLMPDEETEDPNESFNVKTEAEWKTIQGKLAAVIRTMEEDSENEPETNDLVGEDETIDTLVEKLYKEMTEGRYKDAVTLMVAAKDMFPDLVVDKQGSQDTQTDEEPVPVDTVACLRNIFMDKKQASHVLLAAEAVEGGQQKEQTIINEVAKQQVLVQYLKESLAFATQLQKAVPVISVLLGSKNLTDVMEAMEFFVTGFEFGLASTMIGIRRMLPLIWAKENGVKEAVVNAYKRLYLNPQTGNARAKAMAVVTNLSALTEGATLCDLTSLEGLVAEFVKSGDIGQPVVQMLWERFTMKIAGTTETESRAAVQLISMAAGADMNVVKSNIDVLVMEGLGPRADTDFLLARDTCLAIMKLGVPKTAKGAVACEPYRLSESHDMFTSLTRILVKGAADLQNRYWIPLMEQAVNVIYKLAESPDTICGDLIKKLALDCCPPRQDGPQTGDQSISDEPQTLPAEGQDSQPKDSQEMDIAEMLTGPTDSTTPSVTFASGVLTRLLSLVGHVALRQLVHLDMGVFGEMKRRRAIQEQKAWIKTPASKRNNQTKDSTSEAIEEELGLAGSVAEDAETEYIRKICECEIVTGNSLLAAFGPVLVAVCTNQNKYTSTELQTAASLALAKFMMVSSDFCDQHLQLLFTVLEKSHNPIIRANTIIAMGDLSFRFPNLIEPWTPHLYARLRDDSPQVRKNTMQVLTHLILNDMVKVKGQISEMATCIVDDDDRISNLAKLFFHELSKKGNAVYNIMPDVISRLSDPDIGVDEQNFRNIMKYLFGFIQKDKHCESLVEKLCHRYRATRNDRQWRDLSYCLSLLSYSEKSMAKLHENFMCFADKLAEDEVYNCFCTIVSKSRSFAKTEAKALIDELEHRIEGCHKKGLNEDEIVEMAGNSPIKKKSPIRRTGKTHRIPVEDQGQVTQFFRSKKGTRTTRGGRRKVIDSSDDEKNSENTPLPRTQRARGARKKPIQSFSESDDSDIELFEVDKTSKKRKDTRPPKDNTDGSDSEPLSPRKILHHKGRNKRRLNSLQSPLSLNNTPV